MRTRSRYRLTPLVLALAAPVLADTNVGGLIVEDTTWTAAASPYVVTSQLIVGDDAVLTIEPGVTVKVGPNLSVLVGSTAFGGATLIARGTADLPITITSDTPTPHAGDWAQLVLGEGLVDAVTDPDTGEYLSGSILEHCSVGFAGGANATTAFRVFNCSPYLADLTIHDMSAQGMLLYPRTGKPAHLRDCAFLRITAPTAKGGALYIGGENAPHVFERCRFEDNTGDWGGAVYAYPEGPAFIECTFLNNHSGVFGGAVYAYRRYQSYDRCTFEGNSATREGGALWSTDGGLTLTDCTFTDNHVDDALAEGGAVQIDGGVSTVLRCRFIGNSARGSSAHAHGGALRLVGTNGVSTIQDCSFEGNSAWVDDDLALGGALYVGDAHVIGNTFIGNSASGQTAAARVHGGAVDLHGQGGRFESNIFEGNSATGIDPKGGAVWLESLGVHLVGNTFLNNTCSEQGGAVYIASRCSLAGDPAARVFNTFSGNQGGLGSDIYNAVAYDPNGKNDVDASYVCWGTSDLAQIAARINDFLDDSSHSVVGFVPPAPGCANGCTADWNNDAAVDTQDFIAYLNTWSAKSPGADLDGNGTVNTADFIAFLNLWAAGC